MTRLSPQWRRWRPLTSVSSSWWALGPIVQISRRADQRGAYRIERLSPPLDLERLHLKNLQPPRPLMTEPVGPDFLVPFRKEVILFEHFAVSPTSWGSCKAHLTHHEP
jgi:hypothetical protein